MITLPELLTHFKGVLQAGPNQWSAICPAHDDSSPSLAISEGENGKPLLFCHAGCQLTEILSAAGIEPAEVVKGNGRPRKKRTVKKENSKPAAARSSGSLSAGFPNAKAAFASAKSDVVSDAREASKKVVGHSDWAYHNADGEVIGAVVRFNFDDDTKTIRPISFVEGLWRKQAMPSPRPIYNIIAVNSVPDGGEVWITEGEKCAELLNDVGLVATTTAGGSKALKHSDLTPLFGKTIHILPDNDEAGRKYANDIRKRLTEAGAGCKVSIVELAGLPEKGDVYDFMLQEADGNPAKMEDGTFRQAIRDMIQAYAGSADVAESDDLDLEFPNYRAWAEEYHDSGECELAVINGEFYRWAGYGYRSCGDVRHREIFGNILTKKFKEENQRRAIEFAAENPDGTYKSKIKHPNSRDVSEIESWFRTLYQHVNRTMPFWDDSGDNSVPSTGVLDPQEAICCPSMTVYPRRLLEGSKDACRAPNKRLLSTWRVTWNYDLDADCPNWIKFLNSLWPDEQGREYQNALQRAMGYTLLAGNPKHKIFMLVGPERSGKGTILRVIETLLGGRGDDSSVVENNRVMGTSFVGLIGGFGLQRAQHASVVTIGDCRIDGRNSRKLTEKLLMLTGGDTIDVNRKGLSEVSRSQSLTIWAASNEDPEIKDDSGVIATRFVKLETFVSNRGREDVGLTDKLKAEMPGIFNWAMLGLMEFMADGQLPSACDEDGEDEILNLTSEGARFLSECVEITGDTEHRIRMDDLILTANCYFERSGQGHIKSRSVKSDNVKLRKQMHSYVRMQCAKAGVEVKALKHYRRNETGVVQSGRKKVIMLPAVKWSEYGEKLYREVMDPAADL